MQTFYKCTDKETELAHGTFFSGAIVKCLHEVWPVRHVLFSVLYYVQCMTLPHLKSRLRVNWQNFNV